MTSSSLAVPAHARLSSVLRLIICVGATQRGPGTCDKELDVFCLETDACIVSRAWSGLVQVCKSFLGGQKPFKQTQAGWIKVGWGKGVCDEISH